MRRTQQCRARRQQEKSRADAARLFLTFRRLFFATATPSSDSWEALKHSFQNASFNAALNSLFDNALGGLWARDLGIRVSRRSLYYTPSPMPPSADPMPRDPAATADTSSAKAGMSTAESDAPEAVNVHYD